MTPTVSEPTKPAIVRKHVQVAARIDGDADVGRTEVHRRTSDRHEWYPREPVRIEAEEKMGHGGISGERCLVDFLRLDVGRYAGFHDDLVHHIAYSAGQIDAAAWFLNGVADTGDRVLAVDDLRVEPRCPAKLGPVGKIEHRADHGRGPDVECDAVPAGGRVAGFHADHAAVGRYDRYR